MNSKTVLPSKTGFRLVGNSDSAVWDVTHNNVPVLWRCSYFYVGCAETAATGVTLFTWIRNNDISPTPPAIVVGGHCTARRTLTCPGECIHSRRRCRCRLGCDECRPNDHDHQGRCCGKHVPIFYHSKPLVHSKSLHRTSVSSPTASARRSDIWTDVSPLANAARFPVSR